MGYQGTWDPDSKREFELWLNSANADEAGVKACQKLLLPLKEGMFDEGPEEGATPCLSNIRRASGVLVDIYCFTTAHVYVRCVAVDKTVRAYRLVLIGPFDKHRVNQVAQERAEKW